MRRVTGVATAAAMGAVIVGVWAAPISESSSLAQAPRAQLVARQVVIDRAPKPKPPPLEPGITLYGPGDEGPEVREIQARLRQIAWFYGDVSDHYGDQTRTAVAGFQGKRGFPVTGEVDQRTLARLQEMSSEPTS